MYIKTLSLKHFRNYSEQTIHFNNGINILYGQNAQGKTNIIEAIYLCATSKSHRTNKDKELIKLGEEEGHIRIIVDKDRYDEHIDIHLKKNNKKGVAVNKLPVKKLNDLFGIVNVIIFSPEDLGLLKNGPKERRKFINIELCQLDKQYCYHLQQYHKVLKQRNNLLKNMRYKSIDYDSIYIWDEQLLQYGEKIISDRELFISTLNNIIYNIHYEISGKKEELELKYEKNVNIEDFRNRLKSNIEKDIKMGSTTIGPHRDDIIFLINNIDIRNYGSQGQQRTAALSLKLSEIQLVRDKINDTPILLLDDVLSELDKNRQKYLIDSLENIQTIITCTGVEDYLKNNIDIEKLYNVKEGQVYISKL